MNYKPDDDSAKLKTPSATLKQVKDVVNKSKTCRTNERYEGRRRNSSMRLLRRKRTTDEVVAEEETVRK